MRSCFNFCPLSGQSRGRSFEDGGSCGACPGDVALLRVAHSRTTRPTRQIIQSARMLQHIWSGKGQDRFPEPTRKPSALSLHLNSSVTLCQSSLHPQDRTPPSSYHGSGSVVRSRSPDLSSRTSPSGDSCFQFFFITQRGVGEITPWSSRWFEKPECTVQVRVLNHVNQSQYFWMAGSPNFGQVMQKLFLNIFG